VQQTVVVTCTVAVFYEFKSPNVYIREYDQNKYTSGSGQSEF